MARRRWQYPYLPYGEMAFWEKAIIAIERIVKGSFFGCMMCGNCLLQKTQFICPMRCPKGLRNGPCGGSTSEKCYVDKSRPCIWYLIYDKAFKNKEEKNLLEVLPPIDGTKRGRSAWLDLFGKIEETGFRKFLSNPQRIFRSLHQPNWWQGDAEYHFPSCGDLFSELGKTLRSGKFVVTCEVSPPISGSREKFEDLIEIIKPWVTAVNFVSNPSANVRMSSFSASLLAIEKGVEPILQINSRDVNRINLQSLAIGSSVQGVKNILCITGDGSTEGANPTISRTEVDVDAIQALWILRRMRDEKKYLDGREIRFPPRYFLGAAASPFASQPKFQAIREEKKINAGAQFLQTNLVFDLCRFSEWLEKLNKRNILGKAHILAGVMPLRSIKMAEYLSANVPGVVIPKEIMKKMEEADLTGGASEKGIEIAVETIDFMKKIPEISGVHLMTVGWEEIIPRIIKEAEI